jgi:peptidoglycan/xylan/chitin deacetylase (PgdA/CDA1 family)
MSALILAYHRIAQLDRDCHQLATPPERFAAQLETLGARFPLVALDDLDKHPRAVAVTLDDGTRDALDAADILARLGVPATFFVTTARLDELHEHWWDTFERIFDGLPPAELRTRMMSLDAAGQAALLAELPSLPPRDSHRALIAAELVELAARPGCRIGAHSVHHLWLAGRAPDEQHAELAECKATLEARLAQPVVDLAYPFGAVDDNLVAAAAALGFSRAVTTEARATRSDDTPFRLPRVEPGTREGAALIDWAASFFA